MLFHRRQDAEVPLHSAGVVVADVALDHLNQILLAGKPPAIVLVPRPDDFSFPSGHTGASFAAASALYFSRSRLRFPALVLAVLIGFSRLYLYVHYPTDVLAGAVLGSLLGWVGCTLTSMVKKRQTVQKCGTVAFILGFYEPFLNAVHSLFCKNSAARRAALFYLLKLGIGWGVGLIGSILLLALSSVGIPRFPKV